MWRCGCRNLKHLNRTKMGNRGDPNSPDASKAGSCLNVTDDLYVILFFRNLLHESWLFSISRAQIFKRLRSLGIDSKKIDFASLCSLADRYDKQGYRHIGWRNRFLGMDSWAP
jgi:hypothetical protein